MVPVFELLRILNRMPCELTDTGAARLESIARLGDAAPDGRRMIYRQSMNSVACGACTPLAMPISRRQS